MTEPKRRGGGLLRKAGVIAVLLALLLCGPAAAADALPDKVPLVTEEYDLMNFPAKPRCFALGADGTVAVGFEQAGRVYCSILRDGRLVQTLHVYDLGGSYAIGLQGDTLLLYPVRGDQEWRIDLHTREIRRSQLPQQQTYERYQALSDRDTATCGGHTLAAQVVDGHYQLLLDGRLLLQCSVLMTWLDTIGTFLLVTLLVTCWIYVIRKFRRGELYKQPPARAQRGAFR